ncbi:unnamed protein product [Periconia digitata]|uniref:Transglutaminase-like domain-containing protein n=1 Tax=Periconia digitata TaxID=1303443 RepID=A0A9W4XLD2_9PLEO|nr:unnamed protein product [Periconia digitata]
MAETQSIKARIASLNIEQVHAPAPSNRPTYSYEQASAKKKPPPPPPPPAGHRPPVQQRHQTINNPPITSNAPYAARHQPNLPAPEANSPVPKKSPALPPRLPPRKDTNGAKQPPPLPSRQPSQPALRRQESNESIATMASGNSDVSNLTLGSAVLDRTTSNDGKRFQIRAPPFDPTKLPPLPARKQDESKEYSATRRAMTSTRTSKSPVALPPTLPSRPAVPARAQTIAQEPRKLPPAPRKSALEWGMNKSTETPPPIPTARPSPTPDAGNGAPPPVPRSSRPNLDAIMASKPKPGAQPLVSAQNSGCLICRDFSAPDQHAAQFPRQTLPSSDAGWLANQLCAPFSSHTDKARAIFTWLHHNVDYDCHSFFSGNITRSTPERTIKTGLAVCEGYAGLFAALALKAGLEAIVVTGHGKGIGHTAIQPGEPLPKYKGNHAWNAFRLDDGAWKLIDPCWGAGHLGCDKTYERKFNPSNFTKSNIDFGYTHFPEDNAHLYREDGRISTWEEYCMDDAGQRLQIYGSPSAELGISTRSFAPSQMHIKVDGPHDPIIRFSFAVNCAHWDHERNGTGKPYIMTLSVGGRDGRNSQQIPFNTDGKVWWLDVERRDLGAPGQKINVCYITHFDKGTGRGLSLSTYKARKGKVAQQWSTICMWELV